MTLRFARESDAAALLAIYAQYIDTSVTFEYTLPTETEFSSRIRDTLTTYPYLVCESGGCIVGYAYAHRYRERAAYSWCVELSVYVDQAVHRSGIGHCMYDALENILRLQGVHNMYALVTQPNEKSNAFHTAMGFTAVGRQNKIGYKAGAWHDICLFEKHIAPFDTAPTPLIPFPGIIEEAEKILSLSFCKLLDFP